MEALILAAGYAQRLRPLTDTCPKPLLPLGDRPIIAHLLDRLAEVRDLNRITLICNDLHHQQFVAWASAASPPCELLLINDGTRRNEDRLGAIGAIDHVLRLVGRDDDWLVVAGDNYFDYSLAELAAFHAQHDGSTTVVYRFPDPALIPAYSVVELAADRRVISFTEKPAAPTTDLVGTTCYLLAADQVTLVARYLAEGGNRDAPGYLMQWLHQVAPVYGHLVDGIWFDIGDLASLQRADNLVRERQGLPRRERYELER